MSHMKVEQQRLALRMHIVEQEQTQVMQRLEDVEDRVVQWTALETRMDEMQEAQR